MVVASGLIAVVGLVFAAIAALIHVYIFILESVRWTHPRTRAVFGVGSEEEARITKPLAYNQGFYNLFLAIATVLGIVILAAGAPAVGATLIYVGCGSMLAAALVLVVSNPKMVRAASLQGVPPLLAIVLVAVASLL